MACRQSSDIVERGVIVPEEPEKVDEADDFNAVEPENGLRATLSALLSSAAALLRFLKYALSRRTSCSVGAGMIIGIGILFSQSLLNLTAGFV